MFLFKRVMKVSPSGTPIAYKFLKRFTGEGLSGASKSTTHFALLHFLKDNHH
jgi:hypothetical protein